MKENGVHTVCLSAQGSVSERVRWAKATVWQRPMREPRRVWLLGSAGRLPSAVDLSHSTANFIRKAVNFGSSSTCTLVACPVADCRETVDSWFRNFNPQFFLKVDRLFSDENEIYHNSVILRNDNPYKTEIIEAFEMLFKSFEGDK